VIRRAVADGTAGVGAPSSPSAKPHASSSGASGSAGIGAGSPGRRGGSDGEDGAVVGAFSRLRRRRAGSVAPPVYPPTVLGEIDPDRRVRLRPAAAVWREVEGEMLGLTMQRSEYVTANVSAAALWGMLREGASVRALADALASRWALDGPRALADARRFVRELDAAGLLEPAD
jgi:hypothetical protein